MSSICKDLRLNPRVHSCFTCPAWVSFFCWVSNRSLVNPRRLCEPQTTLQFFFVFFLLCTVIWNWRSSMTEFVSWRLCLIVFKMFSDRSGIRTHAHTRVLEFSTVEFLEPGVLDRSAILPGFRQHILSFDVWPFHWVNFPTQRCNLLSGLCHPFQKICVSTHA